MLTRRSVETLFALVLFSACGAPSNSSNTTPPVCPPAESIECPEPAPTEPPAEPVEVATEPVAQEATPEERQVLAGACDLDAIPAGLIEETTPEQNEAIIAAVHGWVNGQSAPWLIPREGILFAKSQDDLGADPPHPTWTREQGERACGLQTLWLRDRLLAQLRLHADPGYGNPIRCTGNVCCYSALGEYDSGGGIIMSSQGDGWRLRAGYEVAINGAVGADHTSEVNEQVKRRLQRLLRGRCAGEPSVTP